MKIKSLIGFLALMTAFGICVFSQPQTVNAQTNKDQKVTKPEREDDDNDNDEKISREDAKKVKISMKQAKEIALKKIKGTIIDAELEKEKGRLQYAFDIRDAAGKVFDVEIDAITGEVLQAIEDGSDDGDDDGK